MDIATAVALIPYVFASLAFFSAIISLYVKKAALYSIILIAVSIYAAATLSVATFEIYAKGTYTVYPFGGWPPPLGIVYVVDELNVALALIASIVLSITSVFNVWYLKKVSNPGMLVTLILLLMAGVYGCLLTGDLFNFFVMLEVTAISSYALTAFFRGRKWAVEAAMSYAITGAVITTTFFFAVVYLYASYGTVNMADVAAKANGVSAPALYYFSGPLLTDLRRTAIASAIAVAVMLWSLIFEAGLYPNNFWLPSAYTEAPSPASAIFAGIVDKVGTYGVLRLFVTIFAFNSVLATSIPGMNLRSLFLEILSILGLISALIGALLMIVQTDSKRLLSYSTISHIGLIFMTFAALENPATAGAALTAVVLHMAVHAISESTLFLSFGGLATAAGSRDIDSISATALRSPVTRFMVSYHLLNLLGLLPPGFTTKFLMFSSLFDAGRLVHAVLLVIISGVSSIGYIKPIYSMFRISASKNSGASYTSREGRDADLLKAVDLVLVISFVVSVLVVYAALNYLPLLSELYHRYAESGYRRYIEAVNNVAAVFGGLR